MPEGGSVPDSGSSQPHHARMFGLAHGLSMTAGGPLVTCQLREPAPFSQFSTALQFL